MITRHQYPFEKLNVCQEARKLVKATYEITSNFPQREVYGLTSQTNRAAVSVAANLAEGSARRSRKDQAHFSEISYGSLMELACLFILHVMRGEMRLRESKLVRRDKPARRKA